MVGARWACHFISQPKALYTSSCNEIFTIRADMQDGCPLQPLGNYLNPWAKDKKDAWNTEKIVFFINIIISEFWDLAD